MSKSRLTPETPDKDSPDLPVLPGGTLSLADELQGLGFNHSHSVRFDESSILTDGEMSVFSGGMIMDVACQTEVGSFDNHHCSVFESLEFIHDQ